MLSLGVSPVVTEAYFLFRKLTKFVCKIFNCTTTLQIVAATDSLKMYDKYNKTPQGLFSLGFRKYNANLSPMVVEGIQ